jgi:hypothetical protein
MVGRFSFLFDGSYTQDSGGEMQNLPDLASGGLRAMQCMCHFFPEDMLQHGQKGVKLLAARVRRKLSGNNLLSVYLKSF